MVNERIMRLRIHHSFGVISLVSVYAPTEASDLTMKDAFFATPVVSMLRSRRDSLTLAVIFMSLLAVSQRSIYVRGQ